MNVLSTNVCYVAGAYGIRCPSNSISTSALFRPSAFPSPPPPTFPTRPRPCFARDTQFLCCVEILLGTVGAAPSTLVDGAAAGLGAVLEEMHRESFFAAASSAEVS